MRALILFLLLLAGCGYHWSDGNLPGQVRDLYLEQPFNSTRKPLLENFLTRPLAVKLGRQQGIILHNRVQEAEAVLRSEIVGYRVEPLSYAGNDRISTYQATLTIRFTLKRQADGVLLWQGQLERHETYAAVVDKNRQEDLEAIAQQSLAEDIADDLLQRLVMEF